MTAHRVFRKSHSLAWTLASTVLITAGCIVDAALSTQAKSWIGDAALAAVVWATFLFLSRAGVHVQSDGVHVVNVFRTRRLRWDEIERFEVAPAGRYPFAGHVIL